MVALLLDRGADAVVRQGEVQHTVLSEMVPSASAALVERVIRAGAGQHRDDDVD